jgi:hypothetical protein
VVGVFTGLATRSPLLADLPVTAAAVCSAVPIEHLSKRRAAAEPSRAVDNIFRATGARGWFVIGGMAVLVLGVGIGLQVTHVPVAAGFAIPVTLMFLTLLHVPHLLLHLRQARGKQG